MGASTLGARVGISVSVLIYPSLHLSCHSKLGGPLPKDSKGARDNQHAKPLKGCFMPLHFASCSSCIAVHSCSSQVHVQTASVVAA